MLQIQEIAGGVKMARAFKTIFDSVSDFNGFYITTPRTIGATHSIATDLPFPGISAHKSEPYGVIEPYPDGKYYDRVRRGYPTIQFQNIPQGVYKTPIAVTLKLWLDVTFPVLTNGEYPWFSPITFTCENDWVPVYTVAIGATGYMAWNHVPVFDQKEYIYQASASNGGPAFPMRQLVKLDMFINSDPEAGYVKMWQDGTLISHANLRGQNGSLMQTHAGWYSHGAVNNGSCYNSLLEGKEVASEAEAVAYFNRSVHTPVNVGTCSGHVSSPSYTIKPEESYCRITMHRNAWPNTPNSERAVRLMIYNSLDGGLTWNGGGGFASPGGQIINKDGDTISCCSFVNHNPFPGAGQSGRLIRVEVDSSISIDTLVEMELSSAPMELQEILK